MHKLKAQIQQTKFIIQQYVITMRTRAVKRTIMFFITPRLWETFRHPH